MVIRVPLQHMPPVPEACKLQSQRKEKIWSEIGKREKLYHNIMQPEEDSDTPLKIQLLFKSSSISDITHIVKL